MSIVQTIDLGTFTTLSLRSSALPASRNDDADFMKHFFFALLFTSSTSAFEADLVIYGGTPAGLSAGIVAAAGTLNLDDICAQIGQCLGAPRPCKDAGEIKNADAIE
jgi:hypothetical protein